MTDIVNIKLGIPQGKVLAAILFLLFMNDLILYVESVSMFADDTMIDVKAKTTDEVVPLLVGAL